MPQPLLTPIQGRSVTEISRSRVPGLSLSLTELARSVAALNGWSEDELGRVFDAARRPMCASIEELAWVLDRLDCFIRNDRGALVGVDWEARSGVTAGAGFQVRDESVAAARIRQELRGLS